MITIIKDKEPIYDTDNFDAVLLGVSTHNMFMGNFQSKMAVKYPIIEKVNNSTPYGDIRKLGKRITVDDTKPIISLMYICKYPSRKDNFIDYEALENCLKTANSEFKGKKVLTTVLGSTKFDGKGDKEKCLKIIEESTKDLDLYVYDYEQITIKEEIKRQNQYFRKLKDKYKGNKEMQKKIKELSVEMRKKTFLPTDMYLTTKKNKEDDEILNF
jgi:hypothetical protein